LSKKEKLSGPTSPKTDTGDGEQHSNGHELSHSVVTLETLSDVEISSVEAEDIKSSSLDFTKAAPQESVILLTTAIEKN
jgi:hypothetical protein